jgi:hypothetical protein
MRKQGTPSPWPDFDDRRVVDHHLDRLDTRGVSRRDFVKFMSAAAASAGATTAGLPSMALADAGGKLAYLSGYIINEWNQQVASSAGRAAKDFGLSSFVALDSHLNAQEQANHFDQEIVGGAQGEGAQRQKRRHPDHLRQSGHFRRRLLHGAALRRDARMDTEGHRTAARLAVDPHRCLQRRRLYRAPRG